MKFEFTKLGSLVDISSSKRIFAREYVDTGIPFYRSKEIIEKSNSQDITQKLFITEKRYNQIKNNFGVPEEGDLLLTSVGTLGVPYIVRDEKFYFKDGNLTWFNNFHGLINKYLYYWFLSPFGKEQINKRQIGSTQKALTISDLKEFDIMIPSLKTQIKIVDLLYAFDQKIEVNNKIIANLEEQAQAIFKSWFVDFEPFQDGEFVECEWGLIPEGWEIRKLEDDLEFIRGVEPGSKNYKTAKDEGSVKFYRVGEMLTDTNIYVDTSIINDKIIEKEDVLVSFDGTVGRVAIGLEGSHSSGIRNIKAKHEKYYPKSFIFVLANSKYMQDPINEHATGTTILHASKSIDYMKIPYKLEVVKEIVKIIEPIYNLIINKKTQNNILSQIRDTLLPKLMSGEIDVSDIKLDAKEECHV